ncbi:MAG TPA: serine hydrolase domain-containing protein [Candidatus Kapabacteria bacterium]|nr:serine hydrolase domain-containing protein [Candidatus Kapabacteria bacterium]HPO62066.1 serine hydrolase domain-containing protein [Candidatus Kapabacteria bacterium]
MKSKYFTNNCIYSCFFIFVLALFIISCESDSSTNNDESQNQKLINQMKEVTDSIVKNTDIPGIVALVVDHKRGIDWLYESGYSDLEQKIPMDKDYTFRIASNTKTMTVTVLLQLVAEGKLSLNDTLSKWYPEFKSSEKITIAMLCNMTSGYFNYTNDEEFKNIEEEQPDKIWKPMELIDLGLSHDLVFEPGKGLHYSNTNLIILGLLIEKITGNSLQTEIQNRIITPLKLTNTNFLTSGIELPGVHGKGYYTNESVKNKEVTEYADVSKAWAAGSAYSTPRELQKYIEAVVNGELLTDSIQQIRLNDYLYVNDEIMSYGLGIMKLGSFYGHNGEITGFTSTMFHSKKYNCTIIIYFNTESITSSPDYLLNRFFSILFNNDI